MASPLLFLPHLVLHLPSLMGWLLKPLAELSPLQPPHLLSWEVDNLGSLFLKDLDMTLRSSPPGRHCLGFLG